MFHGTVAVVTGAGTGIGRAIALRLAHEGVSVALAGRRLQLLEETARMIEERGGRALAVPTDLARQDEIERLVDTTTTALGKIDHLINNAVMNFGGAYHETSLDQIRTMIDVSLTAPLLLTRLCVSQMMTRKSGNIVMIGSTAFVGWPYVVTYSAIKAALDAFAQGLRREVASAGVHVAVVHPAGTDTPSMTPVARREFEALGFRIYSSEVVASATIDAIMKKRARVVVGAWERRHVLKSGVNPRLIDRELGRMALGFQAAMLEHQTPSE